MARVRSIVFKDLAWTGGGAVLLLAVFLLALHYHREEDTATRAAFQAQRLALVERIRTSLASASEAEKSAVMATTDEDSRAFAEQARAGSAAVEQRRDELDRLLASGGNAQERELLSEFSRAFTECQRVDQKLLDLAVKNTNLKAYALAFGPTIDALAGMDSALAEILKENATTASAEAGQVMLLAAGARSGAWRIQALLPPHIFEGNDQKMDELEATMAKEDEEVRSDLKRLASLCRSCSTDVQAAVSGYARFSELKSRILELSRENTNVRSLMMSLSEKRDALKVCQEALVSLEKSIQEEPLIDRMPESPR